MSVDVIGHFVAPLVSIFLKAASTQRRLVMSKNTKHCIFSTFLKAYFL